MISTEICRYLVHMLNHIQFHLDRFKVSVLLMLLCLACTPKTEQKSATAPEGMVYVPAGSFSMGGKSSQAQADELPRHEVAVSAFYMDQTEVTNAQFARFVKETGYVTVAERGIDWEELKSKLPAGTPKPPDSVLAPGSLVFQATEGPVPLDDYSQWWRWVVKASWNNPDGAATGIDDLDDHPVVHITYEDALAYAKWAGKRLPTEAEWEWAALGGELNNKYAWGNQGVDKAYDKANFWQGFFPYENDLKDNFYTTAPVKSFPANGYGLYDMAGNVWEWCQDRYHAQHYEKLQQSGLAENPLGADYTYDPNEPYNKDKFVIRGGSFLCNDSYCSGYRVSRRMAADRNTSFNHTGFRCVKDIDE
ncbi:MAG: formylglycine-generating enzyme family protein [Bacteroidota bacterium]